jgi:hypothetical protein
MSKGYVYIIKDYIYDAISYLGDKIVTFILCAYVASNMYVFWIVLHYFASHLYVYYCVPKTFIGFLMSPFLIVSPQCQSLRWILYNAANIISNMWVILGSWLCSIMITKYGVAHDNP